jgi:diguanylate cyclase (GGDEF)-like protein
MVLLAPETDRERAAALAEKVRKSIEEKVFETGKVSSGVTVSIGLAVCPRDARAALDLVSRADQALYAAKAEGRNRVVLYEAGIASPVKKD